MSSANDTEGVWGCGLAILLALGFGLYWLISTTIEYANAPETLYDVEIRIHYVDGYSTVLSADSISELALPIIEPVYCRRGGWPAGTGCSIPTGAYALYFNYKRYIGVVRFEYLKKHRYEVPIEELRLMK